MPKRNDTSELLGLLAAIGLSSEHRDRNLEPMNVVDALVQLAGAIEHLACAVDEANIPGDRPTVCGQLLAR